MERQAFEKKLAEEIESRRKPKMAPIQNTPVSDWEKAVHDRYSLVHISKHRIAIIERVSFAPEYYGVQNVCSYREVFRGTLAQVVEELKQLRAPRKV